MRIHIIAAALAGSIAAIAPASAQLSDQAAERLLEADSNNDGAISRTEVLDARAQVFGRLDRNGDNVVSAEDAPRLGPARARFEEARGQFAGSLDQNGDGAVTLEESQSAPTPGFDRMDADGDDLVTQLELEAARAQIAP